MKKLILYACLLMGYMTAPAAKDISPPTQSHVQIKNVVAAFVQQQTAAMPGKITYQINDIDQRITLPECARLEAFLPESSQLMGNISVGVRCMEKNGWSIFVQVQIRSSRELIISARPLLLGQVVHEEDISHQTTETTQPGGITDAKQVIGKVLRYSLSAGTVLREDMLRAPYSVKQGQSVQLIVQGSGFSLSNSGVAMNNAGEGETVQVRTATGRVISGIAGSDGLVRVKP